MPLDMLEEERNKIPQYQRYFSYWDFSESFRTYLTVSWRLRRLSLEIIPSLSGNLSESSPWSFLESIKRIFWVSLKMSGNLSAHFLESLWRILEISLVPLKTFRSFLERYKSRNGETSQGFFENYLICSDADKSNLTTSWLKPGIHGVIRFTLMSNNDDESSTKIILLVV